MYKKNISTYYSDNLSHNFNICSKYKYIAIANKNQDIKLSEDVNLNPEHYFRRLPYSVVAILDNLLRLCNISHEIYPTQQYLANKCGISRMQCSRALKKLVKDGLISKRQCFRKTDEGIKQTSCLYTISPFFSNPFMRSRLSHIFKAFKALALASLFSVITTPISLNTQKYNFYKRKSCQSEYVTPYIKGKLGVIYNNNTYSTICKSVRSMNKNKAQGSGNLSQNIFGKDGISPIIKKLKDVVPFTKWAQIKLSAFPDEAIEYTVNKLKYAKSIREPFNWFIGMCLNYCSDNDIKPDWHRVELLAKSAHMPDNAPMLLDKSEWKKPIPTVSVETSRKKNNHKQEISEHIYSQEGRQKQLQEQDMYLQCISLSSDFVHYEDALRQERWNALSSEQKAALEHQFLQENEAIISLLGIIPAQEHAYYAQKLLTPEERSFEVWAAHKGHTVKKIGKSYKLVSS